MEFDNERVATMLDAEKIHEGDLVLGADTLSALRKQVRDALVQHNWKIDCIKEENEPFRFCCKDGKQTASYALVYLLATAENVEAFEHWVYTGCDNNSVKIVNGECNSEVPEFWNREVTYAINDTLGWRPYKDVKELLDDFTIKMNSQMPSIWVRAKKGYVRQITGFEKDTVYVGIRYFTLKELFDEFEFVEGSPCGVYVGV